jgi:uncharacterized membrane protein
LFGNATYIIFDLADILMSICVALFVLLIVVVVLISNECNEDGSIENLFKPCVRIFLCCSILFISFISGRLTYTLMNDAEFKIVSLILLITCLVSAFIALINYLYTTYKRGKIEKKMFGLLEEIRASTKDIDEHISNIEKNLSEAKKSLKK